mmetsp:Transcript_152251/g.386858  ORF Transcript_152251/g.386858 Transcript_152251/m.386858 type:complete len:173 (-) Transcript_152251:429-947(-)
MRALTMALMLLLLPAFGVAQGDEANAKATDPWESFQEWLKGGSSEGPDFASWTSSLKAVKSRGSRERDNLKIVEQTWKAYKATENIDQWYYKGDVHFHESSFRERTLELQDAIKDLEAIADKAIKNKLNTIAAIKKAQAIKEAIQAQQELSGLKQKKKKTVGRRRRPSLSVF